MSDEFDIYGDDTFDLGIQSDDILGEIVGESTTREAKRQKLNKASNDDDLFEDFGEIDKKEKMKRTSHDRQNDSSQQQQRHPSSDSSSNTPKQTTSQQQQQQPLQKIPTTVSTHTQSPRSTSGDSPSSRRAAAELPQAMASLRGIVTHPTTAFYLGELAWYVNDDEVKAPLVQKGLDPELKELTFFEQKVNGKSRGIVFLEFKSVDAAVKAKEAMDTNVIDGKTPATAFTSSTNPFKHIPKETSSKSQRTPDTRMSGANTNRMMGNAAAAGGGFNPMMPNFNPAAFGNMNMNPYGGFNPMAAAAAARGGFMGNFENMMNMAGVARGGRGGGGGMAAMRNQQFMHRMGRGGPMMGGGGGASGPAGNGGMYINPAFFEQQQQGGGGPGNGGA
ncbi:hypothetical protein O0I10_005617 [Lichtheimia ornata]|uniref:RRM domain-containing protein n=1 Tax=Lichtheimia ornata TaxID=688661 RepID=A0AAD7V5N2_9FUNG|nr:uncharacterized protein O0I10_005617 [Lichtheimia ornata]KAJ8658577.1 hypothetical protein O0I10_005617 [Lichtheimia ornata]